MQNVQETRKDVDLKPMYSLSQLLDPTHSIVKATKKASTLVRNRIRPHYTHGTHHANKYKMKERKSVCDVARDTNTCSI